MTTEKDGVRAYRENGRSVEGLSKNQLGDILEQFPRDSDAHSRASNKLDSIHEMEKDLEPKLGDVENRTKENSLRAVCHDLDTNNERTGDLFIAGRGRDLDELLRSLYNREIDEGQPGRLTEFTIQKWQGERWEEVDLDL